MPYNIIRHNAASTRKPIQTGLCVCIKYSLHRTRVLGKLTLSSRKCLNIVYFLFIFYLSIIIAKIVIIIILFFRFFLSFFFILRFPLNNAEISYRFSILFSLEFVLFSFLLDFHRNQSWVLHHIEIDLLRSELHCRTRACYFYKSK